MYLNQDKVSISECNIQVNNKPLQGTHAYSAQGSQLKGDNHSWFHLVSSFRSQPPPKHSLFPATAQSSFSSLRGASIKRYHNPKIQKNDMMLHSQGTSSESSTAPDIMQYTQSPKKKHPMLYLTP